jgi:hypothetical protein
MLEIIGILMISVYVAFFVYGLFIRDMRLMLTGFIMCLVLLIIYGVYKANIHLIVWQVQRIKGLI